MTLKHLVTAPYTSPYIALPKIFVLTGLLLLALAPAKWLLNSWQDSAYDSTGLWGFLLSLGLLIWSATSSRLSSQPINAKLAYTLLGLTALTRLLGQVLAINTIGAIALVIDVYALALLLATQYRSRPLSPAWLALLFAFSLPVERIVQRLAGYFLQEVSASASCGLISVFNNSVSCQGTRIDIAGQLFLIDLPCSGTNSLVLLGIVMTTFMVVARPNLRQSLIALTLIPVLALVSNIFRIIMLVTGSIYPVGIDVMAQPWHELTGLLSLLPAIAICFWFFKKIYHKPIKLHPLLNAMRWEIPNSIRTDAWWLDLGKQRLRRGFKLLGTLSFVLFSSVVVSLEGQAVDVSHPVHLPELPIMIQQQYKYPVPLLGKEKAFFTQYGGDAKKAVYGERRLLLTKTTSPLRHLHAPDECLRGLGFKVSYLGSIDSPIPSAIYKATSPTGEDWKVAVSFVSQQGYVASNVSEAVWKWVQNPATEWSSLQRISPWKSSFEDNRRWDKAVLQALDI